MTLFEALVLGILQGLTEFIPVSSSGHLLLAQEAFGNSNTLLFDVLLHVGTLLALLVYFHKDVWLLLINLFARNKQGSLARTLLVATIPAVIVGLLFNDFIEQTLRSPYVVVVTLAGVAVLMLLAERYANKHDTADVTMKKGVLIGCAQALALIPGVSRSGITITTGLFMGLSRVEAARFSFLLAIPIIAGSAAGTYLDNQNSVVFDAPLLVGLIAAFVSGLLAIKFLLHAIGRFGLKPFAYYRLALAFIVLLILL